MKAHRIATISYWILMIVATASYGQTYDEYPYPQEGYINPLGIEWKLSGTFGEPRGNHFHAGCDVKTNGATGYKLYSIADGYVSRVKVSPFGYGKAIYINHYDGYTSVYGHMSSFSEKVDSLVRARQYAEESFEQDIYLDYNEITFNQGEIIGLSGNSGGSGGPHLHFEIRESSSQKPINPLFFGYEVKDTRKPQLMGVKLTSYQSTYYNLSDGFKQKYYAAAQVPDTIEMPAGKLALGVHSLDQQDLANNRNGVFRIGMFADDQCYMVWTMDQLSFDQGRYVNAFRDFYERKQSKTVYNCYRMPGNQLDVYEFLLDDGIIQLKEGATHQILIEVWDFHKNKSTITFVVKGVKANPEKSAGKKSGEESLMVSYSENYNYRNDDFRIYIPANTFYDDIPLNYSVQISDNPVIHSDIHQLHDVLVPMHKSAVVQVSAKNIPKGYHSKVVMVHKDLQGVEQTFSTFWKDDMVSAKSKEVGYFYVKIDSLRPEIRWLNFTDKNKSFRGDQIRVKISDELTGIRGYAGYIDGQWVLFDYDAKRDLLTYDFDEHCPPGEHKLKVVVTDKVNNKTEREIIFNVP